MREETGGWAYMLASKHYGTLYTGSTRDLIKRISEHKEFLIDGFTKKYGVTRLVWFEAHESVASAYTRERRIKGWKRDWKIALIEQNNPTWDDLYPVLSGAVLPTPLPFYRALAKHNASRQQRSEEPGSISPDSSNPTE